MISSFFQEHRAPWWVDYPNNASLYDDLADALKNFGVAVLTNKYSNDECDRMNDEFEQSFQSLFGGTVDTLSAKDMPPQTRTGLMQGLVTNTPTQWSIRLDASLLSTFHESYLRLDSDIANEYNNESLGTVLFFFSSFFFIL